VEVYNEGEGERKDKGKHREGEAESEQIEELNDEGCKRYLKWLKVLSQCFAVSER
jgi:hypothetical protein